MNHTSNHHDHKLVPTIAEPKIESDAALSSVADGGALRVCPRHAKYCLSLFNYQTQSLQVLDRSAFLFSNPISPFQLRRSVGLRSITFGSILFLELVSPFGRPICSVDL